MSRLRKNFLASLYFSSANQGAQLLQVTAFLHFWGPELYGSWLVINTIPIAMAFSDAGISSTLGNGLTIDYQQGNVRAASQSLNSAWFCQLKIWLVMIALLILAVLVLPVENWLGLTLDHSTFAFTSVLMCGWTLVGQQALILSSLYRASGTYDRFIALTAHFRVVELIAIVSCLWLGAGFVQLAAVLLTVRMGYLGCCWWRARGLLPEIKLSPSDGSWVKFRQMLPSGLSFMSFSLGAGVINQGTALVANHAFGPASVALITTCRQFARVYLSATSIAFTAIQPEMTYVYGQGNISRGLALQRRALGTVIYTAPLFCLFVMAVGPWIVGLWTRGTIVVDASTMLLFSIEASLMAIGNVAVMSAWSMNKNVGIAGVYIGVHGLALAAIAVWVEPLGIKAIPAAFSIAGLLYIVASLVASARIVNLSAVELLLSSLAPKAFARQ